MCRNDFWKKISVFSITLLLGFFAAEFFKADEAVNIKLSVSLTENIDKSGLQKSSSVLPQSKRRNCVPADSNLKYRTLLYDKPEQPAEIVLKVEPPETKSIESIKSVKRDIEQIERRIEEIEELLSKYDNFPQPRTLLYKEKCFGK